MRRDPNEQVTITMTAAQAAVLGLLVGETSNDSRSKKILANKDYDKATKEFALCGKDLFSVYVQLCNEFEADDRFKDEWGETSL